MRIAVVGGMFLLLLLAAPSAAQDRGFGAGVIFGEPTGISGKGWVSQRTALDFGLAYSFRSRGYFHVHADYLWHFPDAIVSAERIPLYAGIGGRLAVGKDKGIVGVRIVGGIALWLSTAPIEFFLEVAPILNLAPATEISGNGGIGVRYYFR